MADRLELAVVFTAIDKFLRPVNAITSGARAASKELKATKDALKALNAQQKLIDSFRGTNKALGIDTAKLEEARQRVKKLADEMAATAAPTATMQRAFGAARTEAAQLSANVNRLIERKQRLRHELSAVGVDTRSLASAQGDLKGQIDLATGAVVKQTTALEAANKKMQRLKAAQADLAKTQQLAGKMRSVGAGITAGGVATGLPVVASMKAYADFETAMLGVARQVDGAKDANGRYTQTYFEMGDAIKAISERLPLTASDMAAIVEAGARMGIQGKQNLLTFAETTAVMASAFDLPVDQVGEDIGKISQLYKVPIKDINALGDTINYLDDNALAKGGDIIDVMKRIAGTASMAKMNFKEAAALGSTFLSLGSGAEVAATASNAMIVQLSNATMQSNRFQDGLKMLKLRAADVQLGMTKDGTGMILKVLDAIKQLPQEKQLEASTRLFGKEFGDDAAKLASNLAEYRRQLELVNAERAKGSMQRESDTRNNSVNARMVMVKNALSNMASDLGETMRPAMVDLLEKVLAVAQAIRSWSKENPQLASGIMTMVKWLAIGLTVIGTLVIGIGAVLAPLAMMKFGLAAIGITGSAAVTGILSFLGPIAKLTAAFTAGYAAGSYLNDGINALISKLLGYDATLGTFIFDVMEKFRNASWKDIGGWIIKGIEAGLDLATLGLYSKVKAIAVGMQDAVKEKLGIHSPSRVFLQIGAYTMQGLEKGLAGNQDGPLSAAGNMARKLTGIGAGIAISSAAMAGNIPLDGRPPIQGSSIGGTASPMQVIFNIYPAPGQGTDDVQQQVERAMANVEAKRLARARSSLRDRE